MASKYLRVMNIGFQNTFVYRWNFLLRIVFSAIPLMGTFYLWGSVFHDPSRQIGGYDFHSMISYFLMLVLLDSLTSPTEDDFQIAGEIRDGLINQFLLKPMDYLTYRFTLFWSSRLIYTAVTLLPVLAMLAWMHRYVVLPSSAGAWVFAGLATILSAVLQFLMAYCGAMLAFWILDVSAPIFIIYSFEYLAGGHVFPLSLLPERAYQVAMLTPFPYEFWFPLALFQERMSASEVAAGFAMQILWCVIFYGLARWIWARGIRHYTAVGG